MFLKEVSAFRECLNKKILMKMDIMIKSTIKNIKFATTDCLTSFIFITDCLTFFFCPLPPVLFLEKVLKVTPSFKNISIYLISSFNFRTQKVSQKMNFCSRWYQIMKLWLLNWKINVILYQISLF